MLSLSLNLSLSADSAIYKLLVYNHYTVHPRLKD
jgi:hypothetical protein